MAAVGSSRMSLEAKGLGVHGKNCWVLMPRKVG